MPATTRQRALARSQPCWRLDLGLPASRAVSNPLLSLASPRAVLFCHRSPKGRRRGCHPPGPTSGKSVRSATAGHLVPHEEAQDPQPSRMTAPKPKHQATGERRPTVCQHLRRPPPQGQSPHIWACLPTEERATQGLAGSRWPGMRPRGLAALAPRTGRGRSSR